MSNVKKVEFRPNVNEEAVELLGRALEMAKAGEMADISLVGSMRDGSVITFFSETDDQFRRLAGVARLMHRLNVSADDVA